MLRAKELFVAETQTGLPCHSGAKLGTNVSLSAVVIEGRPFIGDATLHAIRFVAPEVDVRLVSNIEAIDVTETKVAIYSFLDRGCDVPFIKRAVQRLREKLPGFPLIIISEAESNDVDAGADTPDREYWLPASLGFQGFVAALRRVAQNDCGPSLQAQKPIETPERGSEAARPSLECLTSKESAVLRLVSEGKSNKFIAYEMSASESTIKVHISNMMRKLRVHNRTKLALIYSSYYNGALHAV